MIGGAKGSHRGTMGTLCTKPASESELSEAGFMQRGLMPTTSA